MNYKLFLNWWLTVCVMLIGIVTAYVFGVIDTVIAADVTYITYVIAAVFVYGTVLAGIHSKRVSDYIAGKRDMPLEEEWQAGWFLTDSALSLGMFGTVIGFTLMLTNAFTGIDVTDQTQMTNVLASMGAGMGVALYTTAVGLVTNLVLRLQFFMIESAYDLHNRKLGV